MAVTNTASSPFKTRIHPLYSRKSFMDTTLDRAMEIVNALQMRLFAAAMVFYVLVLTVQVDPFAHYMGAAAFFGLLAIPIRLIFAAVELTGWLADSLTSVWFPGTQP